jgi:D-sedoheptulose 7-phosphate isomerase
MQDKIKTIINDSVSVFQKLLEQKQLDLLNSVAEKIIEAYKAGKKVIVFGNGGSAADAQHLAAELICRFEKDRMALPAIALTANTSNLTAIGNDYGYDDIFSRQIEAWAVPGDIVIGISTSGNSANVLKGIRIARSRKATTIGFTGSRSSMLKDQVDICFSAPSTVTARIQECHVLAIHIICALVEEELFGQQK